MPWAIWSPEDFPKRSDAGYMVDYCQAYGVQIVLKAGEWTELDPDGFYTKSYSNSWVDKVADEKEVTVSAKDLAVRICRDRGGEFEGVYVPIGLMYCNTDKTGKEEIKALEEEGKKRNLEFRRRTIGVFETQFRVKSQGGPGRWTPTTYEKECYDMLGKLPPEVVNRPAVQPAAAAPVIQIVQPDPAMIAELVAAEVAKQRAAEKPKPIKVI